MQKRFAVLVSWYIKHQLFREITPLQIEYCDFLQHGYGDPSQDRAALCYRSFGKTTILKLFQLWYLGQYPWEQVLFITNSDSAAKNCGSAMLAIMEKNPFFDDIKVDKYSIVKKKKSQLEFNVLGKRDIEGSSWKGISYGVRELTGSRASVILVDDLEVSAEANSTPVLIQQLRMMDEIYNVMADKKPHWCRIFTGTYHSDCGFYTEIATTKYNVPIRVYPALYPNLDTDTPEYLDRVSPYIMKALKDNPNLAGTATDRLKTEELYKKPGGVTSLNFRYNMMLDNSGGEESAYPLKCSDLIVLPNLNPSELPSNLIWTKQDVMRKRYLTCPGIKDDAFYGPFTDGERLIYSQPDSPLCMYCDSAGCGRDEYVYVIGTACKGRIYVIDIGAYGSKQRQARPQLTIDACKKHGVRLLHVEINNNHSIRELLQGIAVSSDCPVRVEGIHNQERKEKRVLSTLTEVFAQHRLVIDEQVVVKDRELSRGDPGRQLFHQIAYARNAPSLGLQWDDRIDALCGLVRMLARHIRYSETPFLRSREVEEARLHRALIASIDGEPIQNPNKGSSHDIIMNSRPMFDLFN